MADNFAVFTIYDEKYVLMHIKDGRAEHIYVYDSLDETPVGSIINCRAERCVDNIKATFIQYEKNSTGFINKAMKGQSVCPLMLKKEAYDDKKALFTDKLSIAGKYAVVSDDRSVKVSSLIPKEEKGAIAERFQALSDKYDIGIIIRTAAYYDEDGIKKAEDEIVRIKNLLDDIRKRSLHTPQYTVLYSPLPSYVEDIMYLQGSGVSIIVTDNEEIRSILNSKFDSLSGPVSVSDRVSLRFYEDKLVGLCNLYSFNAKISEALSKKVYLKSGAYITIEHTESLYAVDVNSASNDKKADREETFLSVNKEAAVEIARQLVLRNMSGMIIIDFINMRRDISYDELEKTIRDAVSSDREMTRFIGFTALKLCELTRSRSGRSLYSALRGSK